VILDHIEKIVAGVPATDVDEPELRLLAELGLWLPLPVTGGLSAREREVALFASLGYSSRFIAERLHLSVRTVDTHLGHVYAKLGVDDRDGLRRWFMTDREFPMPHADARSGTDAARFPQAAG
jgi:DNA-binding CsgD family transcriptional regulator